MSHTEQFRSRVADLKASIEVKDKLLNLKWSMGEQRKALEAEEKASVDALDKWHDDESTEPKPVILDHSKIKAKLVTASDTINATIVALDDVHGELDQAIKDLADV